MTTGWRDIETAPVGEKVIGLWRYHTGCDGIEFVTKVKQDRHTHWEDEHNSQVRAPDYWMPFDPPETPNNE